jgi:hypothetical protein
MNRVDDHDSLLCWLFVKSCWPWESPSSVSVGDADAVVVNVCKIQARQLGTAMCRVEPSRRVPGRKQTTTDAAKNRTRCELNQHRGIWGVVGGERCSAWSGSRAREHAGVRGVCMQ